MVTFRLARDDDAAACRDIGAEAFGYPTPAGVPLQPPQAPGRRPWVIDLAEDSSNGADAQVVGRAITRDYVSWVAGAHIPTSGIASVSMLPEYRGSALMSGLLTQLLRDDHERGAALSTLFPTAPGIYRGLGYATVGSLREVTIPTTALRDVRRPAGSLERVTPATMGDVADVYAQWASMRSGPLTRTGPAYELDHAVELGGVTNFTLARDPAGHAIGFASWDRDHGYRDEGVLRVWDVVATTEAGYALLLNSLGSHAAVAPRTTIDISGIDLLEHLIPTDSMRVTRATPYMLALLDVKRAFELRHYPQWAQAWLTFTVSGLPLSPEPQTWTMALTHGRATLAAVADESDLASRPSFTAAGLALAFMGAMPCSHLRSLGALTGSRQDDVLWDSIMSGFPVTVSDYF